MQYYPSGKFLLVVPPGHKLREYQSRAVLYDRSTSDLIDVVCNAYPDRPVLDIGANIGDTAAYVRTYCENEIVCVEGGDEYVAYLEHNSKKVGSCVVVKKFVRPKGIDGISLRYAARDGSGHLTVANATPANSVSSDAFVTLDEIKTLTEDHGGSPILFKTDTDGFDALIINEALTSYDSVFSFECDPFNLNPLYGISWSDVFKKLAQLNTRCILFDNFGLPLFCVKDVSPDVLSDMIGYLYLQRTVGRVRVHYFDIWAFPEPYHSLYEECATRLRAGLLKNGAPL